MTEISPNDDVVPSPENQGPWQCSPNDPGNSHSPPSHPKADSSPSSTSFVHARIEFPDGSVWLVPMSDLESIIGPIAEDVVQSHALTLWLAQKSVPWGRVKHFAVQEFAKSRESIRERHWREGDHTISIS